MVESTAPGADAGAVPLRGRIPHLAPAEADSLRALHRRSRRWTSPAGTLQFQGCRRGDPDSLFEVDADGTRLGLGLASTPAGDDALQWQDYRGQARILAWSLAHERTLVRLSEALGTSLLPLTEPQPAAGAASVWLGFALHPADGESDPPITGCLRAPLHWLDALLAREPGADAAFDPGPWRQLPALASIALASPPMGLAELRSLRPGDVVVVGTTRQPPLHASAAGLRWPVRATGDGWRIDGAPSPRPRYQEMFAMTDTASTDPGHADAATPTEDPAARLPVEVEFELGRVELRLGDIAGLQPGYVFALPAHLEGANVTIRANGRVAGQGELVAVGETLGVRLLSWG